MRYRLLSQYRSELMGAAMLWIMLFHAHDLDTGSPILKAIRGAGFGGVDIFILLSAMGLVVSLARHRQPYPQFMARRILRILPAYYAVAIPYTLYLILFQGAPWPALFWNCTLLYYWVGSEGAFNWYVAGIMTFYAITPLCFQRLRKCRSQEALAARGIVLGFLLSQLAMQRGLWRITDVLYRIPVFFLGLLMGVYVVKNRRLGWRDWLCWAGFVAMGVGYLALRTLDQNVIHLPLCHLFTFTTIPLCLVLCICFACLPLGWLRKFFRFLGENSLEIYLLNVSLFSQTAPLQRLLAFDPTNRLYYLILITLNILLGAALHRWLERLTARHRAVSKPLISSRRN